MNAFKSAWFWILLVGLLLMIVASLVAGGYCEMNGWAWTFYILGIILVILGVGLGLWAWSKSGEKKEINYTHNYQPSHSPYTHIQHSPLTFTQEQVSPHFTYSHHPYTPHSPHVTPSIPVVQISPLPVMRTLPIAAPISSPIVSPQVVQSVSPLITPSVTSSNIPQAQRGFATTAVDLSALSPV